MTSSRGRGREAFLLPLFKFLDDESRRNAHRAVLLYFLVFAFFSSDGDDDNGNSTADTTSSEKSDLAAASEAANALTAPAASSADGGKPVHKWPIRPGVHVHVNGLHMLNNSTTSGEISGFTYGARNNSSVASDTASEKDRGVEESEIEKTTVARGTSTSDMGPQDDPMASTMASTKKTIASETAHNNSNVLIFFLIYAMHDFSFLCFFFSLCFA